MKTSILVIEDDKPIRNLITTTLKLQNYIVHESDTALDAIAKAVTIMPDIIILDLGLPDIDGTEIIKKVREWSSLPIIVVSARGEDKDKIEALDMGADDYLTKPFSVEELLARIRVALRKINYDNSNKKNDPVFINGGLKIDYAAGCVFVDDVEIHLTPIEYKLIVLLSKNVGKVLTHNFIIKNVWGNPLDSDVPALRVFMATLRRKIEKDTSNPKYIQTHIGVGYRLIRVQE